MKKILKYIIFTIAFIGCFLLGLLLLIQSKNTQKDSIDIIIDNAADKTYYVTLLSSEKSVSGAEAYNGNNGIYKSDDPMYPIWKKFIEYEDENGYYFLQEIIECHGDTSFVWDLYIPNAFKLLLYFPQNDSYIATNIRNNDWTDYYVIHIDETVDDVPYIPIRRYNMGIIVFFNLIRILGAIWCDLSIALLFKYRERKQLLFIGILNGVIYLALNAYLSLLAYKHGSLAYLAGLIIFGSIVFFVKILLYNVFIPFFSSEKGKRLKIVNYSIVSNVSSTIITFILSILYAGIY